MDFSCEINVLAELEHCGIAIKWASDEEVKCLCPFHEDSSPSCHVNVVKRTFKCHVAGCEKGGHFVEFLAKTFNCSLAVMVAELSKRYNFDVDKMVDSDVVERWHSAIWAAFPFLAALRARGCHDELIRYYRLGETEGRISIPIPNKAGVFVNVRKYLPGARGADKMRNMRGRGKPRWFPAEQLKYDTLVICGGEIKAIVAAEQLNRHGIGAISPTQGEQEIDLELLLDLKDKIVYHCLDIDKAGVAALERRCAQTNQVAAETWACTLPLDPDKYPKGDVNDFIASEKGDMMEVVSLAIRWSPPYSALDSSDPLTVNLIEAVNAKMAGKRVQVHGIASALGEAPYSIPKETRVICDRSQTCCATCSVYTSQSDLHTIQAESPAVLEMVHCPKSRIRDALMSGLGIPRLCKVVDFETLTFYNVEDVRVSPHLEITNRASDRAMQPAVCIGDGLELNESYRMTGRMHPNPATQQATLLISQYEPTKDALSTYQTSDQDLDSLVLFQPQAWTADAVRKLLDDVYEDFESNVTRIFKRRNLHLAADLVWHSPLHLTFDGRIEKGWVEVLVVGDSACGKSEVACGSNGNGGLMKHYGLGEKVECKNATVAGLLGGLQNLSGRFFVTWGVVPTHDKRLVILEEVKGANVEVLAKLTDMRSSGVAEIPKIEKRRTHARTRLFWLSNPRSDRQVSTYNHGINVVSELIGSPEDVRRFDMALVVSNKEVTTLELNVLQRERPVIEHRYTSDLCRSLVLWAWTREREQVMFSEEVTSFILECATKMCDLFSDQIPLVDRGSMRLKLARLSAALAARTFSCDDDKRSLVVRLCHVEVIYQFLVDHYSSPVTGYKDFTDSVRVSEKLIDPSTIKKNIESLPYPKDFVKAILHTNSIEQQDIQDWCGWERKEAGELVSFLVRKHALVRKGRHYYKQPEFIELLKKLSENGKLVDRPDFVKSKEEY